MKLDNHLAVTILLSLIGLGTFGCSGCRTDTKSGNNQNSGGATARPGRWVAQYRSPASLNYSGANLAVFYYSGISVVSPSVVFVCGDVPKAGEERVGIVVRTTDGGEHWTEVPIELPRIQIPTLNSIHFISPEVGWTVGVDSG